MRVQPRQLVPLAVVLVAIVAGALGWLPVVVVAPIVLTMPGYLILTAMGSQRDFTDLELVATSVAISMAALILGAQLLNVLPFGITTAGWVILVASLAVLTTAVIVRRRPGPALPTTAVRRMPAPPRRLSRTSVALLFTAVLATAFALVVATAAVAVRTDPGFTELWLDAVGSDGVRISVRSQELQPMTYRLRISTERQPRSLTLQPGELWSATVARGNGSQFRALLYLDGDGSAYREAWLSR